MARLISSAAQAMERIHLYQKGAKDMAKVMSNNVAWYALPQGKGWLFGPSKFIGYDLRVTEYLAREKGLFDGRVTEGVLQKWSEPVEMGDPRYDELHAALGEFCARFNKKPNSRARISIVRQPVTGFPEPKFTDELVSLMVAVYRKLTPAQKAAFQRQAA
jgi:hypothetical protein